MTLNTSKTTGDTITAAEWNESATAANKVTDSTLVAANISDFDTEVSNNTSVTANTAKVGVTTQISNVVEDTTPQLGGTLDSQNNDITNVNNIDYDYATGDVVALGNLGATEVIDFAGGAYFTGTLDANVTITHSNETAGRKPVLILNYDATAQRTITWSDVDKWLSNGGTAPTSPSAAGQVLVVTLLFDGTTCYAVASTNY